MSKKHNPAPHRSFDRHLYEIHGHAKEHINRKNIFHAHGAIFGIAGLKLLAAEAFVIKALAGPLLVAKGALLAGFAGLPFVTAAGEIGIEPMPTTVQAEWASTTENQAQQALIDAQEQAGIEKARQDLVNKIEAENNGAVDTTSLTIEEDVQGNPEEKAQAQADTQEKNVQNQISAGDDGNSAIGKTSLTIKNSYKETPLYDPGAPGAGNSDPSAPTPAQSDPTPSTEPSQDGSVGKTTLSIE